MLSYDEFCTIGTALILISSSFIMGTFFNNLTYDYHLLFNPNVTQEHFDNALRHYQTLYYTGRPLLYILAGVAILGLLGNMIRIYKPNPELKMFEYASLGLYVFGICIFITNIKTGIECSLNGNWGEVTQNQGLAVIGSSNIILLLMFLGVLILQIGLWYTNYDYQERLKDFYAEEAKDISIVAASRAKPIETESKKQQKKNKKLAKKNK
ncbi:Shr3p NDAI_0H03710 [Naumovozyma dairenensis CBS 421]|uniref:Shr3 amino acid permease chaperone n=1 Tax=Naumovozyma dairenensis (strain ATCC 10597 / BCRC 20456 / CBS 421 / NBRC 0211 / NRRL Y-12639) TaxID=1071378 RepID=G0WFI3_NAUDC|nr:hypothetical protein NDAI_0H03710 [Naumovozyma dairenensis CBS 421]CCD26544.1 hypothetical protein NDAI_0H03710 [Naumovozyma dairenensis CBS 421]